MTAKLSRRDFIKLAGSVLAGSALARWGQPPASDPAPNVILITLDTVRAKSLGLYGAPLTTTSQLERLASHGLVFEQALAPSSWTLPTHASIFTGRYPHQLNVGWETALDHAMPTLAEMLGNRGYATAGFVANLAYCAYDLGLDRGFDHYEDYPVSWGQLALSASLSRELISSDRVRNALDFHEMPNRKNAARITDDFLRWLGQHDPSTPYFGFLNFFDAHEPCFPPPPFDTQFGPPRPAGTDFAHIPTLITRREKYALPAEEMEYEYHAYLGAIAYMDQQVGRLIDELDRTGQMSNTVVFITSDHGEQFGEHGLFDHGTSLYRPLVHVPLLILLPGKITGRVETPVTLRDFAATALDLVGQPTGQSLPGVSWRALWDENAPQATASSPVMTALANGGKAVPGWYPVATGDMFGLLDGGLYYIRKGDGDEELYDFGNDPDELQNLAKLPEYQAKLTHLRQQVNMLIAS